jgi:hypothetical protein
MTYPTLLSAIKVIKGFVYGFHRIGGSRCLVTVLARRSEKSVTGEPFSPIALQDATGKVREKIA